LPEPLEEVIYYIDDMENKKIYVLNENGFWQQVGGAFTDPEKRFEFPIKPFEMDLTQETKNAIYIGTTILAVGMVATALILANKK
jgi:hypothetical protein